MKGKIPRVYFEEQTRHFKCLFFQFFFTVKSCFIIMRLNGESCHIKIKNAILILATLIV